MPSDAEAKMRELSESAAADLLPGLELLRFTVEGRHREQLVEYLLKVAARPAYAAGAKFGVKMMRSTCEDTTHNTSFAFEEGQCIDLIDRDLAPAAGKDGEAG